MTSEAEIIEYFDKRTQFILDFSDEKLNEIKSLRMNGITHKQEGETKNEISTDKNSEEHKKIKDSLKIQTMNEFQDTLFYGFQCWTCNLINNPYSRKTSSII